MLISEGLFVARDRSDMADLTRLAAEARATIHVIKPGQNAFDIEERAAPGISTFYDDSLLSEGLEQMAGQTRGTMTTIAGSAQNAFDRLGRELSGYYLIGFEPTDADRTGRERRIRDESSRAVSVQARPTSSFVATPAPMPAAHRSAGGGLSPTDHQKGWGAAADRGCRCAWQLYRRTTPVRQRSASIGCEIGDTRPMKWNGRSAS